MPEIINLVTPSSELTPMPEVIRVGPLDFRVKSITVDDADQHGIYGDFSQFLQRIRVRPDAQPQRRGEVLLHEVLHACWAMAKLDKSVEEEEAVSKLSIQLFQVIRDNPTFVQYLEEAATGEPRA